MTDDEVNAIQEQLKMLANICIDSFLAEQRKKKGVKNEQ
jgi:hypothetical protein